MNTVVSMTYKSKQGLQISLKDSQQTWQVTFICLCFLDHVKLFTRAVRSVLNHDSFRAPCPSNKAAVSTASALSEWCDKGENHPCLYGYSRVLVVRLNACFSRKYTSLRLRREKMWRAYHRLRTSETFRQDWSRFLQRAVGHRAHPAFFQFVAHAIFEELIKVEYPLPEPTCSPEHPDRPLTFEERNALRYVAGYVCRKIREGLESSTCATKDEMICCIFSLAGDEMADEGTESWVNHIDRGGLWHISDSTYVLFVIMEEQIRRYFTTRVMTVLGEDTKHQIHDNLMNDNDVLFQWTLLTTMVEDSVAVV